VIIWSPPRYFVGASSSPILAALEERAEQGDEPRAWNNRSLGGVAPRRADGTLETPIMHLKPAIALKLVPPNDATVAVHECSAKKSGASLVFRYSVEDESVESSWLEKSSDQLDWERFSKFQRKPPFQITIAPGALPPRGAYVRAVGRDQLHNEGSCDGVWVSYDRP
jgi:hypothetical protein